jgi:hypothetical protein
MQREAATTHRDHHIMLGRDLVVELPPIVNPISIGNRIALPMVHPTSIGNRIALPIVHPASIGNRIALPIVHPVSIGNRIALPIVHPVSIGNRKAHASRREAREAPQRMIGIHNAGCFDV